MSLNTSSSFQWDDYLERTNGYEAPPINNFTTGVLLEAVDQRSAVHDDPPPQTSRRHGATQQVRRFRAAQFALATVVEIWGARIRVRLVGTDDRNDCWFLVDSDQIRPYPSGDPLQPPFGYMYSHSVWSRTLRKAIDTHIAADPTWFIPSPANPSENFFREGQKLEAVDRHNAQLICPATIGSVSGEYVQISFDGWSGAFDYWTRYDSRDLLPVGWCKAAGHPLQSPGHVALKIADKSMTDSPSHLAHINLKLDRPERPSSLVCPSHYPSKKKM
ncbi:sex comb on [Cichlidogyrus casuarinus]|uniref:Sex comb on n=1 Tax=Cichlidogyrus casuarinus TaxID=1844966 RepID=A0ABD2PV83_9PLAT